MFKKVARIRSHKWERTTYDNYTVEWLTAYDGSMWYLRDYDGGHSTIMLVGDKPLRRWGKLRLPDAHIDTKLYIVYNPEQVQEIADWYATVYLPLHRPDTDVYDRVALGAEFESFLRSTVENIYRFGNPNGTKGGRLG